MVVTACAIIHDSENSASLFNGIVRKLFGYFGGVKIILVFFWEPASLFLTLLRVCVILMPRRPKKGTIEDWPNASNSPPRKAVFKRNTMAEDHIYTNSVHFYLDWVPLQFLLWSAHVLVGWVRFPLFLQEERILPALSPDLKYQKSFLAVLREKLLF